MSLQRLVEFEGPGEAGGAHTNPDRALAAGYPGPLAQGALSFGLLSCLMRERFGDDFMVGGTIDIRLTKPVWAGDTLMAHGAILELVANTASCRLWAENQKGETVAVGVATSRIP